MQPPTHGSDIYTHLYYTAVAHVGPVFLLSTEVIIRTLWHLKSSFDKRGAFSPKDLPKSYLKAVWLWSQKTPYRAICSQPAHPPKDDALTAVFGVYVCHQQLISENGHPPAYGRSQTPFYIIGQQYFGPELRPRARETPSQPRLHTASKPI